MPCPKCQSNNTVQSRRGPHIGEYCADCGAHIRWVPQGLESFIWPVGTKHKGKLLLEILKTDRRYLEWAAENMTASPGLCKRAREALQYSPGTQTTPLSQDSPVQSTQALPKRVPPSIIRPSSSDDRLPWED